MVGREKLAIVRATADVRGKENDAVASVESVNSPVIGANPRDSVERRYRD